MTDGSSLRITRDGTLARLRLARPAVRNAFDSGLIAELTAAAVEIGGDASIRTVVIEGEGSHFCAGADLAWMRAAIDLDEQENMRDARLLGAMFAAIDELPQTVIGRIHGAAIGGGAGLVAVCDVAIASDDCIFAFSEVRLGLIPAVIGPFALRKIGYSHARALFTGGGTFGASDALRIGLVHEIVPPAALDAAVDASIERSRLCAPGAVAAAKELLRDLDARDRRDGAAERLSHHTAAAIAKRRVSAEAQNGVRAFLKRTAPPWKVA